MIHQWHRGDLHVALPDYVDDGLEDDAANSDEEVVSLEVDFVDHLDRKLFCVVGWNACTHEAEFVDVFDEQGNKVNVDGWTRDAIVMEALK